MRAQAGDADGHSSSCGASERVAVLLLLHDAAEFADAASFLQIASAVCIASMPAVVNSTDLTVATPRNSDVSDARYTRKNVSQHVRVRPVCFRAGVLGALVLTPAHIYIYIHICAYVTYRILQNITLHHVSSQNIANSKIYTHMYMKHTNMYINICVTTTHIFVTHTRINDQVLLPASCAAWSWEEVMSHI